MIKDYQKFARDGWTEGTKKNSLVVFGMGISGEAGEVTDIIKKHFASEQPLNIPAIKDELGDVLWYVANICNVVGLNMEDVMQANMAKLKMRYPEHYKYTRKCGCSNQDPVVLRQNGPHTEMICGTCSKHIKFVRKGEEIDDKPPWEG